jgi:hypothetical protein
LGNTLRSKFKRGKLPVKDDGVDANYVKEKEGMFDLQIIYPINLFKVGAKCAPFFIKVVQYRRGKIEPDFIFNNEYFTKALTDLVGNQKVDGVYPDLGLSYLNAAIREIDVAATHAKKFDDDDTQECQEFCHGKLLTTHLTNFLKCAASADGTLDRIKGFVEWMQIQLSESAEDDGKVYYPFENLFEHGATQGVLKWWERTTRNLLVVLVTQYELSRHWMNISDMTVSRWPFHSIFPRELISSINPCRIVLPMHWLWVGISTSIRHDLGLLHYTLSIKIDTKAFLIYPSLF